MICIAIWPRPKPRTDINALVAELIHRQLDTQEQLDRLTSLMQTLAAHSSVQCKRLDDLEEDIVTHIRAPSLHRPAAR